MDMNAQIFDKLKEFIDLPGDVVSLTLRLRTGRAPTLFIKRELWSATSKPSVEYKEKRYTLTE